MPQITVIPRIRIKEGKVDQAKPELLKLRPLTLGEKGCINYDLFQDRNDDTLFYFYENWESDADLDRHLESDHIAAFNDAAGHCFENIEIRRLSRVE
jgi:quinol monooxygenase YgiN